MERVLVGSRDHSLVSSLKESVSRRNLIFCALSARPGIDILFFFFFFGSGRIIMGTHAHCLVQIRKKLFEEECIKHFNEPML